VNGISDQKSCVWVQIKHYRKYTLPITQYGMQFVGYEQLAESR
jgi:hypothetical protein